MENEALKMELESTRKNLEEAKASNTLGRSANLSISTMSLESGRKEGWLEIPSARGISSTRRDGGWVKVFVILSEDRLFFYANMDDYQAHKPKKIIELSKVSQLWFFIDWPTYATENGKKREIIIK